MSSLTKLFTLLELTRNMPQSGYAVAGIAKHDLSDLAQHHYLTSIIAWQLARHINRSGGNLNIQRVTEYSLVHDLAELFGGDINFYYGRLKPETRKAAKEFERLNSEFISDHFGRDKEYYLTLYREFEEASTDEALVSKIADLLECLHYKSLMGKVETDDVTKTAEVLNTYAEKCKNVQNTFILQKFIQSWTIEFAQKTPIEIITNK